MQKKFVKTYMGFFVVIVFMLLFTISLYLHTNECDMVWCWPNEATKSKIKHKITKLTTTTLAVERKPVKKFEKATTAPTPTVLLSTQKEDSSNCDDWGIPEKWNPNASPQIGTNPDLLLYPGLVWGPNNQIVGFKVSILLAIRLNR